MGVGGCVRLAVCVGLCRLADGVRRSVGQHLSVFLLKPRT
jgi:hypothetical protein